MSVQPSPPKLSDLLAAFGARRLPSSASRMDGVNAKALRPEKPGFSYAESDGSNSPGAESNASSFEDSPESSKTSLKLYGDGESDDELQQVNGDKHEVHSDDVIHGMPFRITLDDSADFNVVSTPPKPARELPKRSTRSSISYASPARAIKKSRIANVRNARRITKLTSDLAAVASTKSQIPLHRPETERNKVRTNIAQQTKPKRDAFILFNKKYFWPLLPETSYIDKLQRHYDMEVDAEPEIFPYEVLTSKPKGVTATMKPYQLEGLSFLAYMHKNGMSAILGDEMGLGKTLQTLSLFQHLKEREPTRGEHRPYLVVCPLSVLSSWMSEAKRWVPDLNAVRFHGPKKERENLKEDCRLAGKASKIDVVVTTYETFVAEQGWFKRAFVWRYCVLDEGHKIKNEKSDISHSLQGLSAEYRLLLTGTPLQNNLKEMWALLHWLYLEVFTADTAENFKQAFDLTKGKVSTSFMDHARRLLELIMLRRMKNSPGINLGLPPKEEILLFVPLTPMQRFWYTRFLTRVDTTMLEQLFKGAKSKEVLSLQQEADEDEQQAGLLVKAEAELDNGRIDEDVWAESKEIMEKAVQNEQVDTKSSDWRKLMNLILQLRKVCNHPYVLPNAAPEPYYLGEHIKTASGKFIVLDKLIEELVVKKRKKILIFAGFTRVLDLCEDLLALKGDNAPGHAAFRYLRLDGGTARARRNLGIRMFNDSESDFRVMLISTRAGGLGINLASATDVVFMDEDWNPQITIQAEARAHRIGQTRKVTVYKLCTQGTVEEQMMGHIRKKLYLSAKITESMRNIHSGGDHSRKRKRESSSIMDEDAPQLDASTLKSLIRRGAQTLTRPEVDVTEMLNWDWQTTLEKCKDNLVDAHVTSDAEDVDEQSWLNSMEKVECAVFEGKKHQKAIEKATQQAVDLNRSDRRLGKNTTVMIGGFAINKKSLNCADWEAVPTMAGKDPRLAEPITVKKEAITHQEFCQNCWDGGQLILCSGCPRSYHIKCLDKSFQLKAKGSNFFCPQHECIDCQAKTANARGLIYRCRWCETGYCEDCLDWDNANLLGETLPEYIMLGHESKHNAWYIECPLCVRHWKTDREELARIEHERERIDREYYDFVSAMAASNPSSVTDTPATISEVGTPVAMDVVQPPKAKKVKL